jgi:hypothetical protein
MIHRPVGCAKSGTGHHSHTDRASDSGRADAHEPHGHTDGDATDNAVIHCSTAKIDNALEERAP